METLTMSFLQLLLADVVLDQVGIWTVSNATSYLAKCAEVEKYEFVAVLAGAPKDVDYKKLRRLAVEELIRFLDGKEENHVGDLD